MKIKSSNPYYHISYWVLIIIILTAIFGRSWQSNIAAFYFVSMLLPIVIGTSYFFNYFLVPKYFLTKKYLKFSLYIFYLVIISLYLEMIVLMISFIYFAEFNINALDINSSNTILLGVILYLLVFVWSFFLMGKQLKEKQILIQELLDSQKRNENSYLEIISNRKTRKVNYSEIVYIESLSNFIHIITKSESINSKEKISKIETRLPDNFIRIHRSFIVNKDKITAISYNEISVENKNLNIGRSYRNKVKENLIKK